MNSYKITYSDAIDEQNDYEVDDTPKQVQKQPVIPDWQYQAINNETNVYPLINHQTALLTSQMIDNSVQTLRSQTDSIFNMPYNLSGCGLKIKDKNLQNAWHRLNEVEKKLNSLKKLGGNHQTECPFYDKYY